jgi:autophagy-related protein 17
MEKTETYSDTLTNTIESIRDSLPELEEQPMQLMEGVLGAQEGMSAGMAQHLESLTSHYGQMSNALQESEAGEAFSDEDLHGMFSVYAAAMPMPVLNTTSQI